MAGLSLKGTLPPLLLMALVARTSDGGAAQERQGGGRPPSRVAAIVVEYPEEGSIFPPEITPPAFLWNDRAQGVSSWRIDVSFGDGAAGIHATSNGARLPIGRIDPDCVADTN